MLIKSLYVEGFRSMRKLSLAFDSRVTTLVGENNTGKSCVGIALDKLFRQGTTDGSVIQEEDFPYLVRGPLLITAVLRLSEDEVQHLLLDNIPTLGRSGEEWSLLRGWLASFGPEVTLTLSRPAPTRTTMRWGPLRYQGSQALGEQTMDGAFQPWDPRETARVAVSRKSYIPGSLPAFRELTGRSVGARFDTVMDLSSLVCTYALDRYKVVGEFRTRVLTSERSNALESFEGSQTASVLLNLKNHADPSRKARYTRIAGAFKQLFPTYDIDAVEKQPGTGIPDIQFSETARQQPLPLNAVSAGVHEVLTFLTNLVGREGLMVFVEHPESHLHPHSMRGLRTLLFEAAEHNQIVVVTHDPQFVEPSSATGLRKVWWSPGAGTTVTQPSESVGEKQLKQMQTALRHLGQREVLFSRAVLLVEDESLQGFLAAIAPTLGYDLDARSVSVVSVDGHDGFPPYHTLLDTLGIPHVDLRDKTWGDNPKYPKHRFFSFGPELERFIDQHGLAGRRAQEEERAGRSKRRQAESLAATLKREEIPELFNRVLSRVTQLATGEPQAQQDH